MKNFYVPKVTDTHSDIFHAIGLASLLAEVSGGDPVIRYIGNAYKVSVAIEIIDDLDFTNLLPGYTYVIPKLTKDNRNYFNELNSPDKLNINEEFKFAKKLRNKENEEADLSSEPTEHLQREVHKDLSLHNIVHSQPKWTADSDLYEIIESVPTDLHSVVKKYLKQYTSIDQKFDDIQLNKAEVELIKTLDKAYSSSLYYNPHLSKGANRSKATSISVGSLYKNYTNWFIEWMKFRGMEKCTIGSDKADYRRILVINPMEISYTSLKRLRGELRDNLPAFIGTVKVDNLAILTLISIMANYWDHDEDEDNQLVEFIGKARLQSVIKGIKIGLYKSLGRVYAPFDTYEMKVPNWFELTSTENKSQIIQICDNLIQINNNLQEERSEEMDLLLELRRFLMTDDFYKLLEFLSNYGTLLMRQTAAKKYVVPVLDTTLDNLLRGEDSMDKQNLQNITKTEGFRNIATAIRKSTINPQMQKAMSKKPKHGPQYGLAQDWKKVVKIEDKFLEKLSNFVQSYNRDTTRWAENNQGKPHRPLITTQDLDQVIELIDEHGSEKVGLLLLAYGYSRQDQEKEGE